MSTTLNITTAVLLPQVTYAAGSITGSYTFAGRFLDGLTSLLITSTLDAAVQISFDGSVDHVAVPAGSTVPISIPINFTANRCTLSPVSVFVKRIGTPTTGSLYVSGFSRT